LPTATPGSYSLGGDRQKGKSTLLKQWVAQLLDSGVLDEIYAAFDRYLLHGGYLTALNDIASHGAIRPVRSPPIPTGSAAT